MTTFFADPPRSAAQSRRRVRPRAGGPRRDTSALLAGLAVVAALALATLFGVLSASLSPRDGGAVAAFFPPWMAAEEAEARIFRAGGVAMGERTAGLVHYAVGVSGGFEEALRDQGAWMLLDGSRLAAWIGSPS